MYDKSLVLELLVEIDEAVRRIHRRFSDISTANDFVDNDEGLDRLDAISMMLIAVGENFKKIDKITRGEFLAGFPEIQWPGVKGVRDVLAHDYFNIDNEEIYNICKNDLPILNDVLKKMRDKLA
ncbi:MAG: DUF86 domain-containing protein [Desulfobacteraceae bacterium]|nr:DUF86 domain-containing protein [Desulfobacteraceae bacterium]MBU4053033.1 DUF86 domain-containing protein [Pseudomonadota bacterium]